MHLCQGYAVKVEGPTAVFGSLLGEGLLGAVVDASLERGLQGNRDCSAFYWGRPTGTSPRSRTSPAEPDTRREVVPM